MKRDLGPKQCQLMSWKGINLVEKNTTSRNEENTAMSEVLTQDQDYCGKIEKEREIQSGK